jgi:hypothetical protein
MGARRPQRVCNGLGFAHDGFAIGTLEGDISVLSAGASQEFIWVFADPGRHVYDAGEEGAVKLQDAKMAQEIQCAECAASAAATDGDAGSGKPQPHDAMAAENAGSNPHIPSVRVFWGRCRTLQMHALTPR